MYSQPKKMSTKRKIEILILVVIGIVGGFLGIFV